MTFFLEAGLWWHLICIGRFMIRSILLVGAYISIFLIKSCTNSAGPGIIVAENPVVEDTISYTGPDTLLAGTSDTTIIIRDGEARVRGTFEGKKNTACYILPAWKGQTLIAKIKPLKKQGNIRFDQIIQPGGITEGPFGDSLNYKFTSNGNMRLVIGSNNMAGKPYTGDFLLEILIK